MLTKVRVRNFKSFVDETFELDALAIIVGANGAGKSNFFDALRFLRSIGEGRAVRDAIEGHAPPGVFTPTVTGIRGGGIASTHFKSASRIFSLDVEMQIDREVLRYSVEVDVERHRVVGEELSASNHPGDYVFSTRPISGPLKQSEESPILTARFHKASRGLNPRRDFSPHDFILSQFTSRRAESRVNEDVATMVRDELASISPLELQPDVLRSYSPMGKARMGEHGENFAAAVYSLNEEAEDALFIRDGDSFRVGSNEEAIARRDAVVAWLSEVTPRAVTELTTETSPTGEVVVSVREEPFSERVKAPSLSDGTLRFAALALATVGSEGRRTLVVEELENGVNPARLALLIRMFEQTVKHDTSVQVVASTHSPAILDFVSASTMSAALVIGWDEDQGSSLVRRVSELPGINVALEGQTLGDLQEEGWLQLAASI